MNTLKQVKILLLAASSLALLATGCSENKMAYETSKPAITGQKDIKPNAITDTSAGCGCVELIRDGSFEDHPCGLNNSGGCGISTVSGFSIGGVGIWVADSAIQILQIPNDLMPQFHNSPNGNTITTNFVHIGSHDQVSTLKQDILTQLQAGTSYHLCFLQSASSSSGSLKGKVKVELVDVNGNNVLKNSPAVLPKNVGGGVFILNAGSDWTYQTVMIPITKSGLYTIKFSSLGKETLAIIDAVSLR